MALIDRGYEAGATAEGGRIMEVTVDEQKCRVRAEPLFDFMKAVLLYAGNVLREGKTIDECGKQFREKTLRQLRLLLIHAGIDSSRAVAIEANMYAKHRSSLLDYYSATKLSPAAIVQKYAGPVILRTVAPRPPVSVAPPPICAAPAPANVQTVNMNLNQGWTIDPNGRIVRQVIPLVNLAEDEQPNPRVPPELRQVRLPAQQQGVPTPPRTMFVIQQARQPQTLLQQQLQQQQPQQQPQPQQGHIL